MTRLPLFFRMLVLLSGLLAVAGCATMDSPARFALENSQPGRVWPVAPEVPRFQYLGQLTGEKNFQADADSQSTWSTVLSFIAGLGMDDDERRLVRPQGVAIDAHGNIIVTDVGKRAVFYFDTKAGRLAVWENVDEQTPFIAPVGVALGANNEILVTDAELGYVVRMNRAGESVGRFGQQQFKRPTGIARDARTGKIYVADTGADDIKVFDAAGKRLATIGKPGTAAGEFNAPTYLAFANEKLYVADTLNSRIQIFAADGTPLQQFGRNGLYVGNMNRPKGITADREGNIYVVESYRDYLLVYNAQGQFLLPIGGTGNGVGRFYLPAGISIDRNNRIYIADMFNGRIVVLQYLGK